MLTAAADEVVRQHDAARDRHFAHMLADWSERDLRRFAALLERFTEDFNNVKKDWLSDSARTRPDSTEGND